MHYNFQLSSLCIIPIAFFHFNQVVRVKLNRVHLSLLKKCNVSWERQLSSMQCECHSVNAFHSSLPNWDQRNWCNDAGRMTCMLLEIESFEFGALSDTRNVLIHVYEYCHWNTKLLYYKSMKGFRNR